MRIVIAPDKFAGTLSATAAAAAIAQGWQAQRPADDIVCVPMADGGDGTLDVVEAVQGGRRHTVEVADASGHATQAAWLELPDGRALIESAQACGLHQLPPERRNPRLTTTYGVGQLLIDALNRGATDVIVGLGGSATVDGGAGMATALGHRLLRDDGNGVKVGGEFLAALHRIVPRPPLGLTVTAATDVDAPLLGPDGAVAGFARQKGAAEDDLEILEQALATLAEVAERDLDGGPWRDTPGAGAAGGLGFGLAVFTGGRLVGGAALVAELVGLTTAAEGADVVISGEGRLDHWSLRGKTTGEVARLARASGAQTAAVVGGADKQATATFDAVRELGPGGMDNPAAAIEQAARELAATFGNP